MPFTFLSLALTLCVAHYLLSRLLALGLLLLVLSATGCSLRVDQLHTLELRPGDPVDVWEMREL